MYRFLFAAVSIIAFAGPTLSAQWQPADVEKALSIVRNYEQAEGCLKDMGSKLAYDVEQRDLNGDGVNELVVSALPDELGKGQSACFARSGQNVHLLISDGAGGWKYQFGFDMSEPVYHKSNTDWPDIEFTGAGLCFPVWRYYQGAYGLWKVCDDNNNLIYADVAPWIKKGDAVPRDAGSITSVPDKQGNQASASMHEVDLSGAEFDHNGSIMAVDAKRGLIIYKEPKASIRGVVKPGDVLFTADNPWDMYDTDARIAGITWLFKKGCAPVAYHVEGGMRTSWHTIVLKGEAPVRKKARATSRVARRRAPTRS